MMTQKSLLIAALFMSILPALSYGQQKVGPLTSANLKGRGPTYESANAGFSQIFNNPDKNTYYKALAKSLKSASDKNQFLNDNLGVLVGKYQDAYKRRHIDLEVSQNGVANFSDLSLVTAIYGATKSNVRLNKWAKSKPLHLVLVPDAQSQNDLKVDLSSGTSEANPVFSSTAFSVFQEPYHPSITPSKTMNTQGKRTAEVTDGRTGKIVKKYYETYENGKLVKAMSFDFTKPIVLSNANQVVFVNFQNEVHVYDSIKDLKLDDLNKAKRLYISPFALGELEKILNPKKNLQVDSAKDIINKVKTFYDYSSKIASAQRLMNSSSIPDEFHFHQCVNI